MAKIADVAKHAGVSNTTVSNVLNGRTEQMSEETLTRVQHAIAELGFHPNRAARFLKTGHTPLIGLLVPSIANPIYGALARKIELVAQEQYGYRVLVGNTYRDKDKETSFLDDLVSHGIRGVIMVSPLLEQGHFEEPIKRGLIAVSYDRRATPDTKLAVDYASMDNFAAAQMAVQHLVEHGHRRLAYVTSSGKTVSRMDKVDGFFAAAKAAGISDSVSVIEGKALSGHGDSEMAELGRALAEKLASSENRPTGIVAMNDMLAIGLIAGLRRCNLSVPRDVSIVGIDDLFLSSLITPELTSVRPPLDDMAKTMVDRIVQRLENPKIATAEYLFQPMLITRESVAHHVSGTSRITETEKDTTCNSRAKQS